MAVYFVNVNDNNSHLYSHVATDMTLADVVPNSQYRITGAADEHLDLQSRLYALGLYPGALVNVLRSAPFGDPLQVKVGGTLLSIRRQEAVLVTVESA